MMASKNHEKQESDIPFKIGKPALRALERAGYSRLKQLTRVTETELGKLHGMGPKALGLLREALEAQGLSFATAGRSKTKKGLSASKVDGFMAKLDHPFKTEVETLRQIIKGVNKDIAEEIKWNAPSFSYQGEYLVTFNLWETKRIHLVFHNPMISRVTSKILEGDYEHRRMTYFSDLRDIKAKQAELEKVLNQLVKFNAK